MSEVKQKESVTICLNCKHFCNIAKDSFHAEVWYNHLCNASPLPTAVDPYDGGVKPFQANSFGVQYFTEHQFEYCRNVNKGNCSKFTDKEVRE